MTPDKSSASEGESRRVLQTIGLVACSCLSVMVALGFAARIPWGDVTPPVCAQERVNPNAAPVGSLVRLPGVGLTRARAIVAHRDTVRRRAGDDLAFRCTEDLQQIKGIGPKTAGDIADWLEFDSEASDTAASWDDEQEKPDAI